MATIRGSSWSTSSSHWGLDKRKRTASRENGQAKPPPVLWRERVVLRRTTYRWEVRVASCRHLVKTSRAMTPLPVELRVRWLDKARALIEGDQKPLGGVPREVLDLAFLEISGEMRARFARLMMGWALVVNLVWWPTDGFLVSRFPHGVEAIRNGRLSVLVFATAVLIVLHGQRTLNGARFFVVSALWAGLFFGSGFGMGVHQDLSKPWFHMLHPLLISTFAVPVSLPRRIPFTLLLAVSLMAGFLVRDPASIHSIYLPTTVGYLLFMAGVGIAFGHAFYLLLRSNFHHQLALEKNASEIAEHRERLRQEVLERTEELHQLAQHLEQVSEQEGRRIARELHDELGQGVTALRLTLATARRRFAKNPLAIESNLDDLSELIDRVATGTRQAIAHLRPQLLDDQGLISAAGWLVRNTESRGGIGCTLHVEGNADEASADPMNEARVRTVHTAAFRVLQESLTNALAHAQATHIDVTLRFSPARLDLEVRDNGVGLPPPEGRRRGMGLPGMRERVYSVGGALHVERARDGGTVIRCSMPTMGAPTEESV